MSAEFPPRRHPVRLMAIRNALLRHGFIQHVWPAAEDGRWTLTWTSHHNRITVVLGPHRGHPAVIPATWDGKHWRASHVDPPCDNVAAARTALGIYHRIQAQRAQEAA